MSSISDSSSVDSRVAAQSQVVMGIRTRAQRRAQANVEQPSAASINESVGQALAEPVVNAQPEVNPAPGVNADPTGNIEPAVNIEPVVNGNVPINPTEEDDDPLFDPYLWEDETESSTNDNDSSGSESTSSSTTNSCDSRRDRKRKRHTRHRRSKPHKRRSRKSPSPRHDTNSIPRVVTRRLAATMAVGMGSEKAKALRDVVSLKFDSKSFTLKCPRVDESIHMVFKQQRNTTAESTEKHYLSFQYKVLDALKPVLAIRGECEGESVSLERIRQLSDTAIDLLGIALNHLSHHRRRNIMKVTDPGLVDMLKNSSHFSEHEIEYLFGDQFIKDMRDQASHMSTMNHVRRIMSQSTRGRGNFNQPSQGRPSQRRDDNNRPPNNFNGGTGGYTRYANSASVVHIGGRLQSFARAWARVVKDPWVLSTITEGLKIDFKSKPFQHQQPTEIPMGATQESICDEEVTNLLAKGAVSKVPNDSEGFICSLFVIPKKSGGFRPIINLKPLNQFIWFEHFKMEGIHTVKEIVRSDDWMVRLDLRDAYLTVPIATEYQHYLQFMWRGTRYQFRCLPFGLGPAPRVFTKILRPIVAFLRERGIRLVIYLDDILLLNEDPEQLKAQLSVAVDILQELGFVINWEKSETIPTQSITFLGLIIKSKSLEFSLPQEKVTEIIKTCSDLRGTGIVSLRRISSLIGNLNWAAHAVPYARARYRTLQQELINHLNSRNSSLDLAVALSRNAKNELEWWIRHLSSKNSKVFSHQDADLVIYSDASLSGWGAHAEGVSTRGPWSVEHRSWHINELELLAAQLAIQSFTKNANRITVQILLDNTVAVSYINRSGGTKSFRLNKITKNICDWCDERLITLQAGHVPGITNTIADAESRSRSDSSDWKLRADLFSKICFKWSVDVDLFAALWNRQLPWFTSWKVQPEAMATNAFSINWRQCNGYAFPPFSLIGRCLAKLRREQAELVLVCPYWPSQSWFPDLLQSACDIVLVLPPETTSLVDPEGNPHPLMIEDKMILTAWRLSGHDSTCKAFRRSWSTYCWKEREQPRTLLTQRPGSIGFIGVTEETKIPCQTI